MLWACLNTCAKGSYAMIRGGLDLSRARGVKAQKRNTFQHFEENTILFNQPSKNKKVELLPRTLGQERLVIALQNPKNSIIVTAGPAGTGKTYLATLAGIQALRSGTVERIVITRPAVGVEDERHGFLPGDLISKMEPWTRPLLDVMREYYRFQDITKMLDDQIIEISPLAYMRGRTFKNAWIIADEMQNATPNQIKMLLTRIGEGSKIIVTGDVDQADRARRENGLLDLIERLKTQSVNGLETCILNSRDTQRHPIITSVLNLYSD
jgi:phosphate starvation-inducible PhoH-like protein